MPDLLIEILNNVRTDNEVQLMIIAKNEERPKDNHWQTQGEANHAVSAKLNELLRPFQARGETLHCEQVTMHPTSLSLPIFIAVIERTAAK